MNKWIDLTGQRFSRWLVLSYGETRSGAAHWLCVCDCGVQKMVSGLSLRDSRSTSCGCYRLVFKRKDLTGLRFGRFQVISISHVNKHTYWNCVCDCGAVKIVRGSHLTGKETVSCGCYARENNSKNRTTHGHTTSRGSRGQYVESPTYRSWCSMMTRCNNPNAQGYEYWGGRGITVCDRWSKFTGFLADMGVRPHGMTLDRYPDSDGNYEPENCRWATFTAQARNRPKIDHVPPQFGSASGLLSFGS